MSGAGATCPVDVVLLDALGTLVALEPPAPRLVRELRRRFGLELGLREAELAVTAEIGYYRGHLDQGRDGKSLAALRRQCAEVLAGALPPEVGRLGPDLLTETLIACLEFTPFPDVGPALEELRAAGARVVVVSNWDCSLHDVLDQLGLSALLDGILTSAQVGVRKPAPEIFDRALALAGVGPERALHVGDSVAEDVGGAHASGIEPVLILRDGGSGPNGVRTIASLRELSAIIRP